MPAYRMLSALAWPDERHVRGVPAGGEGVTVKYEEGATMTEPEHRHPHADAPEEDPESHVGPETPDPWEDDDQRDWPTETVEVGS